jgi:prepilin-type N-terminal cleavage/methylation domain-containing protein
MTRQPSNFRGFTLIELIMVMAILVLVASVLAPSLRGFGIGRKTNDAGRMILAMAHYARTQADAEGRIYRLNLDQTSGEVWLTADNGGAVFGAPTNEYGDRYSLPEGVRMTVTVNPQPNAQLNIPANIQQQSVQGPPPVEQSGTAPNTLVQNTHAPGTPYVEFQPGGRTDPADIHLTDTFGHNIEVVCHSETETFQMLTPGEVVR